jgi:formylglycine-generating enzyme required for sulfatase activity
MGIRLLYLTNRALRPPGSFDTTSQGIVDLNGGVWEWTMALLQTAGVQMSPDRLPTFLCWRRTYRRYVITSSVILPGGCAVGTPPAHLGMQLVGSG